MRFETQLPSAQEIQQTAFVDSLLLLETPRPVAQLTGCVTLPQSVAIGALCAGVARIRSISPKPVAKLWEDAG